MSLMRAWLKALLRVEAREGLRAREAMVAWLRGRRLARDPEIVARRIVKVKPLADEDVLRLMGSPPKAVADLRYGPKFPEMNLDAPRLGRDDA